MIIERERENENLSLCGSLPFIVLSRVATSRHNNRRERREGKRLIKQTAHIVRENGEKMGRKFIDLLQLAVITLFLFFHLPVSLTHAYNR